MTTTLIIALVLAWSIQTVWIWKLYRTIHQLQMENIELEKTLAGARVANEILQMNVKGEDDFTTEVWPEYLDR